MTGARALLATMAVVAAGAMLGRIQLGGVRLDTAAMLLFGAAVAHFGVVLSPALGLFGLLLFLYTVGVQSGPGLRSMSVRELKVAGVGLGVFGLFGGGALLRGWALGLPPRLTLGSFAGFFGSGAALAILEGGAEGSAASAGFAVAAPVAAVLLMILVQVWRRLASRGIAAELAGWEAQMARRAQPPEVLELRVEDPAVVGVPWRELRLGCQVLWVRRGAGGSLAADGSTCLALDDVVHLSGPRAGLEEAQRRLGRPVAASNTKNGAPVVVRKYLVSNPAAIEGRLAHRLRRERFGATVTRIRRVGVTLQPEPGLRFRWGDRVQLSVRADRAEGLRRLLGDDVHGLEELAFPRAALVIFVGGLLGAISIHLGGSEALRLGPALGVRLGSLLTAALHRTGPFVWSQSGPTTRVMAHIGLPLFMAQIGNQAYGGLAGAWEEHGLRLLLVAVLLTLLLALLTLLAGKLLRLGALTVLALVPSLALNTPALSIVQSGSRAGIPGHGYAAVYPLTALLLLLAMFVLSLVL